jgi:hypothetical protein
VDILPSTRKRISSGCTGKGGTAAATGFLSFGRDFRNEDFPVRRMRGFFGADRELGLRAFGLSLTGGIHL